LLMAIGLVLPAGASAPVGLWQSEPAGLICAWSAIFAALAAGFAMQRSPAGYWARLFGFAGAFFVTAGRAGSLTGRAIPLLAGLILGAVLPLLVVSASPGIGPSLPRLWFFLLRLALVALPA